MARHEPKGHDLKLEGTKATDKCRLLFAGLIHLTCQYPENRSRVLNK